MDQNIKILESSFKASIIIKFITKCKRNLETPRLLRLLTALCSVRGVPIPENQSVIANTMLSDDDKEVRNKFLILIRKQKRRVNAEFEICLNMQKGTWMKFFDLCAEIEKIKARIKEINSMPAEDRPNLSSEQ